MNECILSDERWILSNSVHTLSTGISVVMKYMHSWKTYAVQLLCLITGIYGRKLELEPTTQNLCSFSNQSTNSTNKKQLAQGKKVLNFKPVNTAHYRTLPLIIHKDNNKGMLDRVELAK